MSECESLTDCLDILSTKQKLSEVETLKLIEDDVTYHALTLELRKVCFECRKIRNIELEKAIYLLLSSHHPMNGMQICRIQNGATGKHDIKFCRDKKGNWRDPNRFKNQGTPYPKCHRCTYKHPKIYYHLKKMQKKGILESRIEYRNDPIVPNKKDRMRIWSVVGGLPDLRPFLDGRARKEYKL